MILNRYCRQYVMDSDPKHHSSIDEFADQCITKFKKTYGYMPVLLTASQEELNNMHVRIDVEVMAERLPARNMRLYEVVKYRTPRILTVKRTPVR